MTLSTLPRVIAVVGLPGTGKSAVVSTLESRLHYRPLYFGGIVLSEIKARGLPDGPDSERIVREALRDELGMAAMAIKCCPKLLEMLNVGNYVVIDGLYSMAEWQVLSKELPYRILLLAVSAHRDLRYARLAKRQIRPLSKDQVDSRDFAEIEKLDKARPIVLADFQITNNLGREELAEEIMKLFHAPIEDFK